MATRQDPIDALLARLGSGQEPSTAEVEPVLRLLNLWLARRALSPQDREEVASDALLRLISSFRAGRLDGGRPAGAWLRVVADHLAFDVLRKRRAPSLAFDEQLHGGASDDDRIAALLEEGVAAARIFDAMGEAAREGDHETVRVITAWLNLAQAEEAAPSTRQVGERLGVSHMKVQRALTNLRRRLND